MRENGQTLELTATGAHLDPAPGPRDVPARGPSPPDSLGRWWPCRDAPAPPSSGAAGLPRLKERLS